MDVDCDDTSDYRTVGSYSLRTTMVENAKTFQQTRCIQCSSGTAQVTNGQTRETYNIVKSLFEVRESFKIQTRATDTVQRFREEKDRRLPWW